MEIGGGGINGEGVSWKGGRGEWRRGILDGEGVI